MVTNDKIGPTVPSTVLVPWHALRISYRASMTRSCVDRVQFFNLGRGRGRCPGGCQNPGLAVLTLHAEWVCSYQ